MTTTTEAPTRSFTEDLAALLGLLFGGCVGRLQIEAQTLSGLARTRLEVGGTFTTFVPPVILDHVVNDEEIRVQLATTRGEVAAIIALIRVPLDFHAATSWKYKLKDGDETVSEALAKFSLAPSAIVAALGEVLLIWGLSSSITSDVADPILARLAERLDTTPIDVTTPIPLCGAIRNIGQALPARAMGYSVVNPPQRYTIDSIAGAIEERD